MLGFGCKNMDSLQFFFVYHGQGKVRYDRCFSNNTVSTELVSRGSIKITSVGSFVTSNSLTYEKQTLQSTRLLAAKSLLEFKSHYQCTYWNVTPKASSTQTKDSENKNTESLTINLIHLESDNQPFCGYTTDRLQVG